MRPDDALVAEIALKKGWIDQAKLQRAREIQAAAAAIGLDRGLLDILVTKGFITGRQAKEFEDEIGAAGPRQAVPGGQTVRDARQGAAPPSGARAQVLPKIAVPDVPAAPPLPAIAPPLPAIAPLAEPVVAQADAPPLPTIAPPAPLPPREPPPRRSHRAGQLAWAAVFGALTCLLALSIVWAVRARARKSATPADLPSPLAPQEAAEDEDEPGQAPPVQPPALGVAEAALAFEASHPAAHAEALMQLRRALLDAGGAPDAAKLRARLAAREQTLAEAASAAYNDLGERLRTLCAADRFGAALAACAEFPADLRWGPWAERLEADAARVAAEAEWRYLSLARDGAEALAGRDFDKALAAYNAIRKIDIPWISGVGESLADVAGKYAGAESKRLAEAEIKRAAYGRRKRVGGLTGQFAKVQEEVKKRDYAKALDVCKSIPDALRQDDHGKAVAYLEGRLDVALELWNGLVSGLDAARGKAMPVFGPEARVEAFRKVGSDFQLLLIVRTPLGERLVGKSINRLPAAELGQLAEWALGNAPAATVATKVGVLCLVEGAAAEARKKLEEAQELDADVASYLGELDADSLVAEALAAHQQQKWAEARKLLETALDRYGDTPPVILKHPALWKALLECCAKLGEPTTAPSVEPAPLPSELNALTLLPETVLSPVAPEDPRAAQLSSPLQRGSPVRLGLPEWRDYTLVLSWSQASAARLVVAARVSESESSPGQFACYCVVVDGGMVTLVRHDAAGDKRLAEKACPSLAERRGHRLVFDLAGPTLSVSVDGEKLQQVGDADLTQGQIVLATSDVPVKIHKLEAVFSGGWRKWPRGQRRR